MRFGYLLQVAQRLREQKEFEDKTAQLARERATAEAQARAAKDKEEADRLELVNKVVEAGLLDESVAKEATAPVLNALLSTAPKQAPAIRLNGAFTGNGGKQPVYALPEGD